MQIRNNFLISFCLGQGLLSYHLSNHIGHSLLLLGVVDSLLTIHLSPCTTYYTQSNPLIYPKGLKEYVKV